MGDGPVHSHATCYLHLFEFASSLPRRIQHDANPSTCHPPPVPRSMSVSNQTCLGFAGPPSRGRGALRPLWTERPFIVTQHAICICLCWPLLAPLHPARRQSVHVPPSASAPTQCLSQIIHFGFRGASFERPRGAPSIMGGAPVHSHAACYLHLVAFASSLPRCIQHDAPGPAPRVNLHEMSAPQTKSKAKW